MNEPTPTDVARGAAIGACIGDALAMPAHWFYDRRELADTFGVIDRYLPPPEHHPGSILWRSRYEPTEPEYDILGPERRFWGRRGVHYHRNLAAGENTLNLKLLRLALSTVDELGRYDRDVYLERYRAFLLDPAGHRDTYVEECHRGFFENLRRGHRPERCAVDEKHIGGMVAVVPLYAAIREAGADHAAAAEAVASHVAVTHAGPRVIEGVRTLVTLARELRDGGALDEVLRAHLRRQDLPYLRGPIVKLAGDPPEAVLGRRYSTACYLEDSLPATFYLALRYANDPEAGLVANTMAGGDNCHRGAVLGALYGVSGGVGSFPERWASGLHETWRAPGGRS